MKTKKKECLHEWIMVYYGGPEVECKKCQKDIWDVYDDEDANKIINQIFGK